MELMKSVCIKFLVLFLLSGCQCQFKSEPNGARAALYEYSGGVQYYCTRNGVEYVRVRDGYGELELSVSADGKPVTCVVDE